MRPFPTVVLGDLHGNHTLLLRALRDLGFVGADGHWAGGDRRLVQLGDVLDRGPAPLSALDLLMRLQQEARAAGGEVVCLVGNHELFALRAAAGEHQSRMSWTYNGGGAGYREWLGRRNGTGDEQEMPYPDEFYAEFGPGRPYGDWLRTHRVACRAGEYVIVHAGWTPDGPAGVEEANSAFAAAPTEGGALLAALGPGRPLAPLQGPLWARHQAPDEIAAACTRLGCRGLITGHTPTPGIRLSCEGQLIQIDTGMFWTDLWSALGLDEAGRPWALNEGVEPVPLDQDGLVPLPRPWPEPEVSESAPQRFGPGELVRLYKSADGSWQQYLQVTGLAQFYGRPAYEGHFLTCEHGQWSRRPALYPSERVDRFGRPADPGDVPPEALEPTNNALPT
jgi:hypothetical protein